MLNWRLLQNPMNWVTVLAMLALAAVAGHLTLKLFGVEPADNSAKSPAGYAPLSG